MKYKILGVLFICMLVIPACGKEKMDTQVKVDATSVPIEENMGNEEDFSNVNNLVKPYIQDAYKQLNNNVKFIDTLNINSISCSWYDSGDEKIKGVDVVIDYSSDEGTGVERKLLYYNSTMFNTLGVSINDSTAESASIKIRKCVCDDYVDYYDNGINTILGTNYQSIYIEETQTTFYFYILNMSSIEYCLE